MAHWSYYMHIITRTHRLLSSHHLITAALTALVLTACAKHDSAPPAQDSAAAPGATTSASQGAATAPAGPTDITPIRGSLSSVSDSSLTVSTAAGDVRVIVEPPLHVFGRVTSKLASVTPNTFVGVTSVTQPDGSQKATEIHIFPEELRGTGEGSYPMTAAGSDTSHKKSTMTNGTVSASPKAGTPPRMTNGTIATKAGGALTVTYQGGSQTIAIPSDVPVMAIAPVSTKLTTGTRVVVLGKKQADGTMKASSLVLADTSRAKK
jgi:hypothetical protein